MLCPFLFPVVITTLTGRLCARFLKEQRRRSYAGCQHAGCRPSTAARRSAYDRPLRRAGKDPVLAATGVPSAGRTPTTTVGRVGANMGEGHAPFAASPLRCRSCRCACVQSALSQPSPVALRHAVHPPVIVLHSPVIGSNRPIGIGGLEACSATHPQHAF